MAKYRSGRINEEVRKELARIISGMKDPRIPPMVSLVKVDVSGDYRYARVWVSTLGSLEEIKNCAAALNAAKGYIRREIGAAVKLVYTPEFTFLPDESMLHGAHIAKLLHDLDVPNSEEK